MNRIKRALQAFHLVLALCALGIGQASADEVSPRTGAATTQVAPKRQAELDYLASLSSKDHHGILSGQWVSSPADWPNAYELFVDRLSKSTGKQVALLATDYFSHNESTDAQRHRLDELLIAHWNAGGLVSLTWSVDNPWYRKHVGESCNRVPKPCVPGKLNDLTKTDSPEGAYFKSQLSQLGDDLERLQAAGVVVLFRPFHEMNGNWFWWGVQTEQSPSVEEFASLWRHTYRYLTNERKLKNLLWVFAPSNSERQLTVYPKWNGIKQPAPYYYPGKDFVDVIGIDLYNDKVGPPDGKPKESDRSIPTYNQLVALGKPIGLAEFGPGNSSNKSFDFDMRIHEVSIHYPKIGFFTAWQDNPKAQKYMSIVSNPNPDRLMNDPMIITRDRVHF